MALQAQLFRGDPKLEAAAVSDPAHIVPGATGEHLRKIQLALIQLDGAAINPDGKYGPATAAAVLAYKRKRNIINRSYQTQADNIVGKMTMAALDLEMLAKESIPSGPILIRPLRPGPSGGAPNSLVQRSLVFALKLDIPNVPIIGPSLTIRLEPRTTGSLEVFNGKNGIIRCDNANQLGAASQTTGGARISQIFDPADPADRNATLRLVPEPRDPTVEATFGGRLRLTREPHIVSIDAFRPGNAFIDASNGTSSNLLTVEVRAPKLASVPGQQTQPLTETRLNRGGTIESDFISKGGTGNIPGGLTNGRPVNPKPKAGGRNINLAGEGETPDFENYTPDLDFSGYQNSFTTSFVFRPWTEDPVFGVNNGEASNICMRGLPISDTNLKVIKRIARRGCRLTFSGGLDGFNTLKNAFPASAVIEEFPDGEIVIEVP